MSKLDQLKALGDAKRKGSNQFEDAARGRDPAPKSSDGREKGSQPIGAEVHGKAPTTVRGSDRTEVERIANGVPTVPSEAKPKLGRPRIGEVRDKPWLTADPPMSERTWYRRQEEKRKGEKS